MRGRLATDRQNPPPDPGEVTRLLADLRAGEPGAIDRLLPLVYAELHALAVRQMGSNPKGWTLQPTALVNELYLRLVGTEQRFADRSHFVAVAATAMRQILVDAARRREAAKRGDGWQRVTISEVADDPGSEIDVLDLEAAIATMEVSYPRPARIAELRFFGGLSIDEVATALDVSVRTVHYDWRFARASLQRTLKDDRA